MQFALIGSNDESLHVVRAIARSADHAVRVIYRAEHDREALFNLFPHARWEEHWEGLLADREVAAVIVADHHARAELEEQLRKLTQAAVPMIIVHPLHDSLLAYELEMIRESVGGVIVGFYSDAGHPAVARLAELLRSGDASAIGAPEQIVFERGLTHRDRTNVLTALSRDITTLRRLTGEITSLNAVGADPDGTFYGSLAVSLCGSSGVLSRWSVAPAASDHQASIAVIGSRGKAVVSLAPHGLPATLRVDAPGDHPEMRWENFDSGAAAIEQLQAALAAPTAASEWGAICHDLDVVERVDKSLRRKRTIELCRDAQTEEGTFKSLMSASGCVVLAAALLLLVVFGAADMIHMSLIDTEAVADAARGERSSLWLRLWPVYPLAAFLLFQLLLLVARRPKPVRKDAKG